MNDIKDEPNNTKLIKLYPFNGRSAYLIDKFYIIGYNYLTLHQLLIENTPKDIEEGAKELHKFNLDEDPDILNEFVSDYNKLGLPNETILEMIFPKKLDFYYCIENYSLNMRKSNEGINYKNDFNKIEFKKDENIQNFPKSYKVFFTSNPQSENNSKKSINGFAYIFYRKFKETKKINKKKYIYFIPYTFCVISEYPFFNSFYKLCKCIKNFYSQDEIYIPIEFLIYNIVSLSPSPINSDIVLELKASSNQNILCEDIDERLKSVYIGTAPSQKSKNPDNLKLKKGAYSFEYKNSSNTDRNSLKLSRKTISNYKKFNSNYINNQRKKSYNSIVFKCLSGYPLIQYNLSKVLFYKITPEKVITIFLYTFLEKDVIFFSKDIEYLTLTLNAYLNLNFPLNDEKYYFIGAPISFDDFTYGKSEFGLKNYTSIIGVNDQFRPDYKNKNLKIQDHLVIDLDKGELHIGIDEKNKKVNENNKKLLNLIKRICDEKEDSIETKLLFQSIQNLSTRLKNIYEITDNIHRIDVIKFLDYNDGNDISNAFYNIYEFNREIQEAFYEFVHKVSLYFYENLLIQTKQEEYLSNNYKIEAKDNKEYVMNVIFKKENLTQNGYVATEEEIIFLNELIDTMKFQSFVYGFLQSYNPIDLYKIPLTFTEEFLSIISRKKVNSFNSHNNCQMNFFDLIDSLYNGNKKKEKLNFNFKSINTDYINLYKTNFDREIYDNIRNKNLIEKRHLYKFANDKKNKIFKKIENDKGILLYQTYELDDSLLLKYCHSDISKKRTLIENNILKSINVNEIEGRIEDDYIKKKILTSSDICCANLILLFALSLKSLSKIKLDQEHIQNFLCVLFQDFIVFRKYYSILLKLMYKLYQKTNNKNMTEFCYLCMNNIRIKQLVPNEELINIINQINENMEWNKLFEENKKEKNDDKKSKNVKIYGDGLEESPITKNNLYIYHNFTSRRFVGEKEIVENLNKIEHFDQIEVCLKTGEKIIPKIRFNNGIHKFECFFVNQKIILESLNEEFDSYIKDLDNDKLGEKRILDACLNIFIFMRSNPHLREKKEIFLVLKKIFYIFMNQLFILKSN